MRFLIIEDDFALAESLSDILSEQGCRCLGISTLGNGFSEDFLIKNADTVFLSLNKGRIERGFELAELCLKLNICLIFLIDKSDLPLIKRAMQYQPLGLILKPWTREEVFKSIEMAKMRLLKNHLLIKDGHDHIKLNFRDIVYLKADNVYTEIVTRTKRFLPRIGLSEVHANLLDSDFFKVHRSYVVNLRFVDKVAKDYLILRDERVPLSRSKKTELLARLS